MASMQIGPKIGVEGEAEYRAQMKAIIAQTKELKSEMSALESGFDKTTTAEEKTTKKSENLNKQLQVQKDRLSALEGQLAKAENATNRDEAAISAYKTEINKTNTEINKLQAEISALPNSLQQTGAAFEAAGAKMKDFGQSLTSAGKTLSTAITAPLVAAGTASYKFASDAQASFAKVSTILDSEAVSYTDMVSQVTKASNETGVAITDFNEALYSSVSAGVESGKAIEFTTQMVKLAKGGFTDTEKAVDVVTTVLNAYGLSAENAASVSDRLIQTQNIGKTTVDQLASSLGEVIPVAKAANVQFDAVSSAMAILTKRGISTASSATYLKGLFNELSKSGSKTDKALRELAGKGFADLMDEGVPLTDVLAMLDDYAKKNGVTLKDMFSNTRAGAAALSLMSDSGEEYISVLKTMQTEQGATNDAFAKMDATAAEQLQKALNELKNAAIDIGNIVMPYVTEGLQKVRDLAQAFQELDPETQEMIVKAAALAASVGPLLLVGGKLVTGLGTAVEYTGKMMTLLGGAPEILAAITGPVGLAAVGVAGVAIAMSQLSDAAGSSQIPNITGDLEEMTSSAGKARKELEDAGNNLDSVYSNVDKSIEDAAANTVLIKRLSEELIGLSESTDRTAEEQSRMQTVVAELNSLVPEFGLEINSVSGSLNKTSSDIRTYVAELENMTRAQALQQATKDILESMIALQREQIEAQIELDRIKMEAGSVTEQTNAILAAEEAQKQRILDIDRQIQELQSSGTATTAEVIALEEERNQLLMNEQNGLVLLNGELVNAAEAYAQTGTATADANAEMTALNESISASQEKYDEAQTKMDALREMADKLGISIDDVGDVSTETASEMEQLAVTSDDTTDQLESDAEDLQAEWDKLYKSAYNSLTNTGGVFEELKNKEQVSLADMQKNLQSHVAALQNWNANYVTVTSDARYKTDSNYRQMVDDILAMGTDGAQYLAEFAAKVESGSDEIAGITADYGEFKTAKDTMARNLADMQTGVESTTSDIVSEVEGAGPKITSSATGTVDSVKKTMDLDKYAQSKASSAGMYYADGLGNNEVKSEVKKSANAVAQAASGPLSAVPSKALSWGTEIVNNYTAGINNETARARLRNAAAALANEVAQYTHFSRPDKGPLRYMDVYGQELVEAYASGMESKMGLLRDTAADLAGTAALYPTSVSGSDASQAGAQATIISAVYTLLRQYLPEAAKTKVAVPVDQFARGMMPEINRQMGQVVML